jgi:hypothetical protein
MQTIFFFWHHHYCGMCLTNSHNKYLLTIASIHLESSFTSMQLSDEGV